MADIGRRLYQAHFGRPDLVTPDRVRELLRQAAAEVEDLRFSLRFLWTEWSRVVDAWQLASWEQYRDVPRLGRRTRLPERQRELLWSVFSRVPAALDEHGLLTEPRLFGRLQRQIAKMARPPFEFCVVDEAQDIGVAELRFLAALGAGRADALFFARDLGSRSSRRRSPGAPWGSTSAGDRTPCGSTTAPHIRSGGRRTGCCRPADRRPVENLAYFLHEICEIGYVHAPELAPTQEMLDDYKKRRGDWSTYETRFLDLMRERRVEQTVSRELVASGCLLCSEDKPLHCHRRLVAEYLDQQWGGIDITHLG